MSDSPAATPSLTGHFHLVRQMARGWWVFVLRGVVAILFGLMAFLAPGAGLAFMLGILAAWMAIDGVSTLYQAVKGPPERHGFWFWLDGIASILFALAILLVPTAASLMLVYITSFWSIATGVFRLILAFRLGSILMGVFGALAIFFGAWLLMNPGPGLLALIWIVGIEAVAIGILMIGFGWRLRRVHNDPHGPAMGRG
ncbi:HdeD family acid-resistance protein [Roseicella aquatilis]|uniref:HdeD family acid-resistance protein n=1 Tax=Roseicella aquatilis TaxID=2527868 RepID=A0A4R4DU03_9PROT|nr:HdeD family acid-resistance protein [Roseicella aquatilis]TCZ64366.1 HdeD family acid-resistance protein [Roseicella aquatilis]